MMGLVVEEVVECRRQPLRNRAHVGDRHVGEPAGERLFGKAANPFDDAPVLSLARNLQLGQIVKQDGVERSRRIAPNGLARAQLNAMRFSLGSDSGSTNKP